jgi:predicted GIY-YIG superfamily endonuclease
MYVIYGLEDQRNQEVFYVGITDALQARFLQHLCRTSSNGAKDTRVQEMVKAGYLPLMRTLQIVEEREQALGREAYWIHHFERMGFILVNVRRNSMWPADLLEAKKVPERSELTSGVSEFKRQTLKRMHAMEIDPSVIRYGLDLDDEIYKQVCKEMGIATEKEA